MKRKVWLYYLHDPRMRHDDAFFASIRWVGISEIPRLRLHAHNSEAASKSNAKHAAWIRELHSLGLRPVMELLFCAPSRRFMEREETKHIRILKQAGIRLNNILEVTFDKGHVKQRRDNLYCQHGHRLTKDNLVSWNLQFGHIKCKACAKATDAKRQNRQGRRGPFTCLHCRKEYFTTRPKCEGNIFCKRACFFAHIRENPVYAKARMTRY
jgi:hypothetical protein